jgi:hypothetical protein
MDTLKKMKLFPDSWYRKLSKKEMDESRQQLKGYTLLNTLETGLKEVVILTFFVSKGCIALPLGPYTQRGTFWETFSRQNVDGLGSQENKRRGTSPAGPGKKGFFAHERNN